MAWRSRMLLTIAFLSILIPALAFSQPIENSFINALVNKTGSIADLVDKEELARSKRLGIQYTGIDYKWLISFDIPDDIKAGFRKGKYNYTLQTLNLDAGFSVVTLAVGSMNYLQKFYFLNDRFVPPSKYFTRNWTQKESKYFKFRISDPKYFNDYCVKQLDNFVDSLCRLLEIEPEKQLLLEREKFYYTYCSSETEVEKITGYKSKGMSVLAFDEVITAYQTHFHEVAHLLMNFKLQNLGLYTLPFLMEGFAVAVGGRGGMVPRVVTDLGYFLQKSGNLTYDSILTYESFYSQDANMTYAVSGLINSYLIGQLGGKRYIELYKSVNGDLDFVKSIKSESLPLPDINEISDYLTKYETEKDVILNKEDSYEFEQLLGKVNYEENDNYLYFLVNEKYSLIRDSNSAVEKDYSNKLFEDLTNKKYLGEKYIICADTNYIRVYNCFDNLLIASYDKDFSIDQRNVSTAVRKLTETYPPQIVSSDKYFVFYLKKSLFDKGFQFIDVMKLSN